MTKRSALLGAFAFLLFFALFLTGLAPFSFEFPLGDMEGSWIGASVYAGLHHFAYGTQFVFTNGPLFPLYHRDYPGDLAVHYVLLRFVVAVYLAYGFTRLSVSPQRWAWLAVILGFLVLWPTITYQANDAVLLIVPLLTALLVIADRSGWPALVVGVVLSAATALGKSSFIPFCLGAFVLVDVALLSRRRWPIALALYTVSSWALFVLADQRWDDFLPFLVGTYEVAAAYSAALSVDGPMVELLVWLAIAVIVLLAVAVGEVLRGAATRTIAVLRVLLIAGFLFISLKAGFVRHDTHSIASWGLLGFLLVALGLPNTMQDWRPRMMLAAYSLPLVALVASLVFVIAIGQFPFLMRSPAILADEVGSGLAFVADPPAWLARQQQLSEGAAAQMRSAQPLPAITGSIDALSNIQGSVMAAGLDYQPRPTVQENMTFSPPLIARNRAYLEGPEAPQTLLFAPGATDNRHPASVEGSLWPLLLSRYEISGRAGDQLILSRRQTPIEIKTSAAVTTEASFGTDIALPQANAPIFLKLDIEETVAGKLADQAFKPPQVELVERYADGMSEAYRLIPGMIEDGMLISPTIKSADDYEALAKGADLGGLEFPTSIRVETDGAWAYSPAIPVSMETLSIPPN